LPQLSVLRANAWEDAIESGISKFSGPASRAADLDGATLALVQPATEVVRKRLGAAEPALKVSKETVSKPQPTY